MLDDEIIKMFRDIAVEESVYAPSFAVDCLLQVDVVMEGGHTIVIYCGERTLVDCSGISPDGHFGVDDVMIQPISDIEEIHLKKR
ncbi:hypothetical protein [uncultured Methanobrevibacter sp.]|uniref:hypothetical protein n=1 Tax=uncultured Methanobrevibacter sp. TaxID=253161 RepID=UPI0025D2450D|nr:hypothetical protein [uncultured Methanobrevibacter sp.]